VTHSAPPPQHIYLIRHGEKPADLPAGGPDVISDPSFGVDYDGNQNVHSLLPRGWQRSGALPVLFDRGTSAPDPQLLTPTALVSPSYGDPQKTQQHRTYQTIQGVSGRFGIPIDSPFAEGQEAELAKQVIADYRGVVLICWEHHHIPALAAPIPTVTGAAIPTDWPDNRLDVIWSFTAVPESSTPTYGFTQIPRQVLPGDTDTVIPTIVAADND
jgi:hypothetical protein